MVLLFTAPIVSLKCRIYAPGYTEVDFTSCPGKCAVTIYQDPPGSSWRYFELTCKQNCLPKNYTALGLPYIDTCCSYDLCSLHVLQALEPSFPNNVKVKRIDLNYESSLSATTTAFITSNTSFIFSSITKTPVKPMFTSSPSPLSPPSSSYNNNSKLYNNYYNIHINFLLVVDVWIVVSGYVVMGIINIVLVCINIWAYRTKKKRDKENQKVNPSPPR